MNLQAVCSCGASIRAGLEMAGHRVACPRCGRLTEMPRAPVPDKAYAASQVSCTCGRKFRVTAKRQGRTGKCPACGADVVFPPAKEEEVLIPSAEDLAPIGDIDERDAEYQLAAAEERLTQPCPKCGTPMEYEREFCKSCGYQPARDRHILLAKDIAQSAPSTDFEHESDVVQFSTRGSLPRGFAVWAVTLVAYYCSCMVVFSAADWIVRILGLHALSPALTSMRMVTFVGWPIYWLIASWANQRVLLVDGDHLVVRNHPLPIPSTWHRIPLDDVQQCYVTQRRRFYFRIVTGIFGLARVAEGDDDLVSASLDYDYAVNAQLKSGWRRQLLVVPDQQSAMFVKSTLNRSISTKSLPVVSTWCQRILLGESTLYDEEPDIEAVSARSPLLVTAGVALLAIVVASLF